MTEQEWLTCADASQMTEDVPCGDRKMRLYMVAVCRRVADLFPDEACAEVIDFIERLADQRRLEDRVRAVRERIETLWRADANRRRKHPDRGPARPARSGYVYEAVSCAVWPNTVTYSTVESCMCVGSATAAMARGWKSGRVVKRIEQAERAAHADLLRDIFGNPFRKVKADRSWLTSDVVALARGIYEEKAFDRMPILADALQDAGCENDEVLTHCSDPRATHVRGCWVVDLLLGKK